MQRRARHPFRNLHHRVALEHDTMTTPFLASITAILARRPDYSIFPQLIHGVYKEADLVLCGIVCDVVSDERATLSYCIGLLVADDGV